ncbi:MAG TPA: hypothetical protein VGR21_06180 [Cryptosporangiaceae bacterium]|nr:hypothetical protein [Cryptosporangiaceae bacterium]
MRTPAKLGLFALVLALVLGAGLAAGRFFDLGGHSTAGHGDSSHGDSRHGDASSTTAHGDGDGHDAKPATAPAFPKGLLVSQDGYTLRPATTILPAGRSTFSFTVLGPDNRPVREYTPTHDKDLHLILVRRDLSGFQHLHPTRDAAGTWSVPLDLVEPGTYRAFADFAPKAKGENALTLGVDLSVPGGYQPRPVPAPSRTAQVDGYTVTLDGQLKPGTSSPVTLTVARNGQPVTDLQPYLGAYGHLVALRAGDLAYLHVHPDGAPADGTTAAGPAIRFFAEVPTAGTYRLFLDFRHQGVVRTAVFTATA